MFNDDVAVVRNGIREIGTVTVALKQHAVFKTPENEVQDNGEMIANVMLAYRHLEDAAMRLGKVIQAYDGGVSVYKK